MTIRYAIAFGVQIRHRVQGLEPTPDLGRVSFGAEDEQPRQKRRPPLAALPRFNR
jgi:hypothetical protein